MNYNIYLDKRANYTWGFIPGGRGFIPGGRGFTTLGKDGGFVFIEEYEGGGNDHSIFGKKD